MTLFVQVLDATERAQSKKRCLQLDHEKKRMEVSHKRARYELEKAASDRARELEVHPCVLSFVSKTHLLSGNFLFKPFVFAY